MKMALDLEDVLIRNVRVFIEEINKFSEKRGWETEFVAEEIEGWKFRGLREQFGEQVGWNQDTVQKFMYGDGNGWKGYYPISERIWRKEPHRMTPIENNLNEKLSRLKEETETVSVVTARENVDKHVKKRLQDLGLKKKVDQVIFKKNKDKLDYDYYIDDYPYLHQKLESGVHLMVDQPWNETQYPEKPHRKVSGIEGAIEVIRNLD